MAEINKMLDNIGKVVYYIAGSRVYSYQIYGVTITSSDKYYIGYDDDDDDDIEFYENDEGKKWFWTREEAEAKLPQKLTKTISNAPLSFYDSELLEQAEVDQREWLKKLWRGDT